MTAQPLYVTICSECGTLTESPYLASALCADCEAMQEECAREAEEEHRAMRREHERMAR